VTTDSDITVKVEGQGALLSAALTRKAAAAVSIGTYSAWESTATLRLLGGRTRRFGAHGGGERRGHIVSPRAQLVSEGMTTVLAVPAMWG